MSGALVIREEQGKRRKGGDKSGMEDYFPIFQPEGPP